MIHHLLKSQHGGVYIIVICLVVGAIFISFIFVDMFTTYISKNISQKSADAAALAASHEMKNIYEEALRQELRHQLHLLHNDIEQEIRKRLEEQQDEEEDAETPDEDEIREEIFEKKGIPQAVREKLSNPNYQLDAIEGLTYFYKDDEILKMMCDSIRAEWSQVRDAAQYYVRENQADELVDLVFPYNGDFEVYVRVKRKISFLTVPDQAFAAGQNEMYAEGAAQVLLPKGITYRSKVCR
ncbi:hypothetical protein J2S00_000656 [Caldalkalibacillus uzonensis]|uniref:Flp pilus-assembly TadG-like N-terminal domain-containing protein n=1 Tax=Caldalkalibacillus uzonensis TaxID=353224 RepID=A0ABU0CN76_9BACI|nr:hypothetical protein [Caldalkalibacillus uzonensis]MDQ0337873.1 hypothetical protein [Caldalkalibacillus uzonensis]